MKPLVIIAGPTAVGKSEVGVSLAKKINGEIISADSMQVYKGMDIGSAKITVDEMQGIKHYLIDVLDPTEDFNVALFQKMAKTAVEEIISKGKIPILVGGTGFYIQALLYDINFEESTGEISPYRAMLEKIAKDSGAQKLHDMLKEVDPESANIIHANNVKRVIRALEFYHETNSPISAHNEQQHQKPAAYNAAFFVLNDDRSVVYSKIDRRVDVMLENGLIDEVTRLRDKGLTVNHVSMNGLGYKEILMYLSNDISLDEAVYRIKRDSRHFAKRQITWFKREKDTIWIDRSIFKSVDSCVEEMLRIIKEKNIT